MRGDGDDGDGEHDHRVATVLQTRDKLIPGTASALTHLDPLLVLGLDRPDDLRQLPFLADIYWGRTHAHLVFGPWGADGGHSKLST